MSEPLFTKGLEVLKFQSDEFPLHSVESPYGKLWFVMFGEIVEFRVRTFFTKEPETLRWIDSFSSGDVFWDIGANIGCYSLYAAIMSGISVYAFEPSPANLYLLTMNANVNDFNDRVIIYPFALSSVADVIQLDCRTSSGSGDNQALKNSRGTQLACPTYTVDYLVSNGVAAFPNHIKVDVDGLELLILRGASHVLKSHRLRSVMVEVDEAEVEKTAEIVKLMTASGFAHPITRHSPYHENNYYLPVSNYLFRRLVRTQFS
jgi:FkbM family methyltransferase